MTIPNKSFMLLAVYTGARRKYGLAALQRSGLARDTWQPLFAMAGEGTLTDGVKKAVEFLEWGNNWGSIITSGHDVLADEAELAIKSSLVQSHILVPIFRHEPVDPNVERAYYQAQAALMTAFPDHDFVKEQGCRSLNS